MKVFKIILFVLTVLVGILVYTSADVSTTQPSKVSASVPGDAIAWSPGIVGTESYNPTAEILNPEARQDHKDQQEFDWLDLPNANTAVAIKYPFIKRDMDDKSFIKTIIYNYKENVQNAGKREVYRKVLKVVGNINELYEMPERYEDSRYNDFVHNNDLTIDLGYVPKDALSHLNYVRHMANHQAKEYFGNVSKLFFCDNELTYIAQSMIDLIDRFDGFVNSLWSQTYSETVKNNLIPYFGLKISGDSFAKVLEDMKTTASNQTISGQAETRNKRAIEASQQHDKIGAGYTIIIDEQTQSSKGVHERAADENEVTYARNRQTNRS